MIIKALGDSFITVNDKKIYCWANDDGERVQVAISMTVPKVQIAADGNTSSEGTESGPPQISLSEEDKAKIAMLKAKLGIKD